MSRLSRLLRKMRGPDKVPPHPVLPAEALMQIQNGTFRYTYKGVPLIKNPFDFAIYPMLIWELKPRVILEIGSASGGSALWLADLLRTFNIAGSVHSFDLKPVTGVADPLVSFGFLDLDDDATWPSADFMSGLPHPILFIDDGSHLFRHVLAMLHFMHPWLKTGDYLIIEDGNLDFLPGYPPLFDGGPRRSIAEFLGHYVGQYAIDRERCDFFGPDMTWNIDGYIRRVG